MTVRWDETWHRLQNWTNGTASSERLAAQILLAEGYTDVDPTHPLGGKDGGKDALVQRNGKRWLMAVYFPRVQQTIREITDKFLSDAVGIAKNGAEGIAFVTNQELVSGERTSLRDAIPADVELYHLERLTTILDNPANRQTRDQFLGDYDDKAEFERIAALQTGGHTFCDWSTTTGHSSSHGTASGDRTSSCGGQTQRTAGSLRPECLAPRSRSASSTSIPRSWRCSARRYGEAERATRGRGRARADCPRSPHFLVEVVGRLLGCPGWDGIANDAVAILRAGGPRPLRPAAVRPDR